MIQGLLEQLADYLSPLNSLHSLQIFYDRQKLQKVIKGSKLRAN